MTQSFIQLTPSIADALTASISGPVANVSIVAAGVAYSNTDVVVFTRNPADTNDQNAVGTVVTSDAGEITSITIVSGGVYSTVPKITITTSTGSGAELVGTLNCDSLYLFAARSVPYSADPNPDPLAQSVDATTFSPMMQMDFGVKIYATGVASLVNRVAWTANTVYAQYDDVDDSLSSKNFFVINTNGDVYKCIDNAQGSPSTVSPNAPGPLQSPITLGDGYQWLYMYSISPNDINITNSMMPVYADANTAANSVDGAIYSVLVEQGGSGYPQSAGTISSVGANGVSSVVLSANAMPINGYYNGCYLTVWGAGGAVTSFAITSSNPFGTKQQVNIAGTFNANQVGSGYQYQIGPAIAVTGDGQGFKSYAQVNANTGSLERVVVVGHGVGYHYANAQIITPSVFGSNASVRAIISPVGGHGTHPRQELYSSTIGIAGSFSNTDYSNARMAANADCTYRMVGILKNPKAYGSSSVYTGPTFNARVSLVFAASAGQSIAVGDTLIGSARGAAVVVVAWNPTTFTADVSGFNGNLSVGETLTDVQNGSKWALNSIVGSPDIQAYTGTVIYARNVQAVNHSQTKPSDTFHIMLNM